MKKTIAIIISAILIIAAVAMTSFALTQNSDGWYEIATAQDLVDFRNQVSGTSGKAKLVADIDMKDIAWTPIDNAIIKFEGQGHKISNLTYNHIGNGQDSLQKIGLFANGLSNGDGLGGSLVNNVVFENCSLTVTNAGKAWIGGIMGYSNRATAQNITFKNFDVTVNQSAKGELIFGGLIGRAEWGYDGNNTPVSGNLDADCSITVTAATDVNPIVGGLVGAFQNTGITIRDSVVNATITASNTPRAYYHTWWGSFCNFYPLTCSTTMTDLYSGTPTMVYGAKTADEYINLVKAMNDGKHNWTVQIESDLDFAGKEFVTINFGKDAENNDIPFKGQILGNNHKFSNITYSATNVSGKIGLIANQLSNGPTGIIKDLTIADSTLSYKVAGGNWAMLGVFTGQYNRSEVSNCHLVNTKVTMDATEAGYPCYLAGHIGYAIWSNGDGVVINNNTTDADTVLKATGEKAIVAGIVGQHAEDWGGDKLNMNNCINRATLISDAEVAGLVGKSMPGGDSSITNSANYGSLTGAKVYGVTVYAKALALNNVDVECIAFVKEGATVENYGTTTTPNADCSAKVSVVTNPLSAETFASFLQTTPAIDGKASLRVLIVSNIAHLATIDATAEDVTVTLKITATIDGVEKVGTVTKSLMELGLYKNVTANADVYSAAEGNCIFGLVVTDVPVSDLVNVELIVNNGETELHTGSVSFAE